MPRLSSPLNAKASVRSPYALDRSQQNSCVGTDKVVDRYEAVDNAHTCALIIVFADNDVFSGPSSKPQGGPDKPFNSRCHLPTLARPGAGNLYSAIAVLPCSTPGGGAGWWSQTGSNRRPHACKARALPTELWPLLRSRSARAVCHSTKSARGIHKEVWWAQADSNCRPHAYQACALTN